MVTDMDFVLLVPKNGVLVAITSHEFTEAQRRGILHMAQMAGFTPPAPAAFETLEVVPGNRVPVQEPPSKQVRYAQARSQGYTGDPCSSCGSMQVKRNGSCLVCEACGSTTGCS